MANILITGGFGYLGTWLTEYARQDGYHISIFDQRVPDYLSDWAKEFDVILGDVTDEKSLNNCCRGIDVVIHTAAVNEIVAAQDPHKALDVSGNGTLNLLKVASRARVKLFIFFSTFHVYGRPKHDVIDEDTPTVPIHPYAISHLVGELYCRAFWERGELYAISARFSNGYGAPFHKNIDRWSLVLNDLCRMAFQEKHLILKGSGRQYRDFVSIKDIYQAVKLIIEHSDDISEPVLNVGGDNIKSMLEIAHIVQDVYKGRYGEEIPLTMGKDNQSAPPFYFDISKIRKYGYKPEDRLAEEAEKLFALLEKR